MADPSNGIKSRAHHLPQINSSLTPNYRAESTLLSIKRAQLDQQIDLHLSLGGNW